MSNNIPMINPNTTTPADAFSYPGGVVPGSGMGINGMGIGMNRLGMGMGMGYPPMMAPDGLDMMAAQMNQVVSAPLVQPVQPNQNQATPNGINPNNQINNDPNKKVSTNSDGDSVVLNKDKLPAQNAPNQQNPPPQEKKNPLKGIGGYVTGGLAAGAGIIGAALWMGSGGKSTPPSNLIKA